MSVAALRGAQASVETVYLVAFSERAAVLWEQALS